MKNQHFRFSAPPSPLIRQKGFQTDPKMTPKWSKATVMYQKWPQSDPKWPQNDSNLPPDLYKIIKIRWKSVYILKTDQSHSKATLIYLKWSQKYKNGHSSSHRASQKVSRCSFESKLRRASFEGIGMQFYEILQ